LHQENHTGIKNSDTRFGVYGELNLVSRENLDRSFSSFLPNEAQIAQVGSAMRYNLPEDSIVFVKGPHTIFNEHAKDFLK
jgi:hypothetical protein